MRAAFKKMAKILAVPFALLGSAQNAFGSILSLSKDWVAMAAPASTSGTVDLSSQMPLAVSYAPWNAWVGELDPQGNPTKYTAVSADENYPWMAPSLDEAALRTWTNTSYTGFFAVTVNNGAPTGDPVTASTKFVFAQNNVILPDCTIDAFNNQQYQQAFCGGYTQPGDTFVAAMVARSTNGHYLTANNFALETVPEPSTPLLIGSGALGAWRARRNER